MTEWERLIWDDSTGRAREVVDTTGMLAPMKCLHCGHVHDAGSVEVVARYVDCSVWHCPSCKATIDDRPRYFGGSAERVERTTDTRTLREEQRARIMRRERP